MKRSRAYRIEQKERIINKRSKAAKTFKLGKVLAQPNRMAKKHPLDCGNPGCMVCHASKVLGCETPVCKVAKIRQRDEMDELDTLEDIIAGDARDYI